MPLDPNYPSGFDYPSVPGLKAQIISPTTLAQFPTYPNPEPLKPSATPYILTKYVKVKKDAEFAIHLRISDPFPKGKMGFNYSKLIFAIYIDGKFVWHACCSRPEYLKNDSTWETKIDGMKVGKGKSCTQSNFKFVEIETNWNHNESSTTIRREQRRLKTAGLVEIKVHRTKYGKKGGDVANSKDGFLDQNGTVVPEQALKGGDAKSHGTALKKETKVSRGDVWTIKPEEMIDPEDTPWVIFQFLYRSEEALKDLHVIEREGSPSIAPTEPSLSSRDTSPAFNPSDCNPLNMNLASMSLEQIQAVMDNLRAAAANRASSSRAESSGASRPRIKREYVEEDDNMLRDAKRRRGNKGKGRETETVDLTGDSDDEDDEDSLFVT